ncbi:MAG: hypothetical protein ACI87E_002739 [Mariniblastus sp.]|jgi:hypothetical protein
MSVEPFFYYAFELLTGAEARQLISKSLVGHRLIAVDSIGWSFFQDAIECRLTAFAMGGACDGSCFRLLL